EGALDKGLAPGEAGGCKKSRTYSERVSSRQAIMANVRRNDTYRARNRGHARPPRNRTVMKDWHTARVPKATRRRGEVQTHEVAAHAWRTRSSSVRDNGDFARRIGAGDGQDGRLEHRVSDCRSGR